MFHPVAGGVVTDDLFLRMVSLADNCELLNVEISLLEQVDCVFGVGMLRVDRDNRIFFAIDLCHLFLL